MREKEKAVTLIIENDEQVVEVLTTLLSTAPCFNYQVTSLNTLQQALPFLSRYAANLDLIILDLKLKDGSGVECVRSVRRIAPKDAVPIVVLTATDDDQTAVNSLKAMADEYLVKGRHTNQEILERIRNAVVRFRAAKELTLAGAGKGVEVLDYLQRQCESNPHLPPHQMDSMPISHPHSDTVLIEKKSRPGG